MAHDDAGSTTPKEADGPDFKRLAGRALRSTGRNSFRTGVILGVLITVAVVLLIIQNGESVQLDWIAFHFRTPLWIMLLLTAAAGAVVWELIKVASRRTRRSRRDRREAAGGVGQ